MLGVEHDYYPNLEVFFQLNVYPRKIVHPSMWGGAGGDLSPPRGFGGGHSPRLGALGASDPSARV